MKFLAKLKTLFRTETNLAAGMPKENAREQRGGRWLENIAHDVRLTLRQLRKQPGFATVACWLPAPRAAKVDPTIALRCEQLFPLSWVISKSCSLSPNRTSPMNVSRLFLFLLFLAPIAGVRAESYDFKESVTRSGAFAAVGRVTLENVNGSVEIRTWDKNEILVEAEKSAATDEELKLVELTIDLSAADAAIKVRLPKRPGGLFGNKGIRAAVKFNVTVPATATLEKISVVNARVTIDGVRGAVNASSVNGAVRATRLGGDAKLSTVNGAVNAEFGQVAAGQRLSFNTVNGGLVIRLPKDTGAELKASVVNGRVSCDFPLESGQKSSGKNVSGRIGDGRASLEARTVNGGVRIEQL